MDITAPILLEKPRELLNTFIEEYSVIHQIDKDKALRHIKTGKTVQELKTKWYSYLDENNIECSVFQSNIDEELVTAVSQ